MDSFVKGEIGKVKTDVGDKETGENRDSESDIEHHVRRWHAFNSAKSS